jgi:poly-gamma-glutamate synthesis protein (capsule biosynthesis protein)
MNRKNRSILIVLLPVVILAATGWYVLGQRDNADETNATQNQADSSEGEGRNTLRLVATGDMIAHDSVIANAETNGGYDFYSLMQNMQPYFAQADVSFCNEATPAGGEQFGISGYPIFNAPLEWHDGMEQVGCSVINLGTNHTYDKGEPLVDAMVADWQGRDVLATAGAHQSQAEREQISYFELDGVSFAFLSYSTYSNQLVPNDYSLVQYDEQTATREIRQAADSADIVLVSMRWGDEYAEEPNARDSTIARTIAEAGADYVFGHGPHVLQPVERINTDDGRETVVWYSLGNFLNTQIPAETLVGGFAVMDIDTETLKLESLGFLPTYSHYEWSADDAVVENLLTRENLQMYALDEVDDSYFQRNQLDTTVQTEREHLTNVLNRMTEVTILSSSDYLRN